MEAYEHRVANKGTTDGDLWVRVLSEDDTSDPSEQDNPFVFSNGTVVEETNALIKWQKDEPRYDVSFSCVRLAAGGLKTSSCSASLATLCKVKSECEEKCPMNNGSDRFRANLPVFAIFMAVFKAFNVFVAAV